MKILVLSMSHNCAEIAPFFLRHYSTFADKIVIWDDFSNDGTRDILGAHPSVSMRDWPKKSGINEDVFLQHWYEEYPKARGEFDWVMIPDMDEFLIPANNGSMVDLLNSSYQWDVINAEGYNLVGKSFPKDDGRQIYAINPMGIRADPYRKPVVFRPTVKIRWARGRQNLESCDGCRSPRILKLLHARFFGSDYTRSKNAHNYERCGDPDKGSAWSCKPDYDAPEKEHSPMWADAVVSHGFNVLKDKIQ